MYYALPHLLLSRPGPLTLASVDATSSLSPGRLIQGLLKIGLLAWLQFAMFHLGRTDVLPVGDLGVRKGMQTLYGLKVCAPTPLMTRLCHIKAGCKPGMHNGMS